MLEHDEDVLYYITLYNENLQMLAMPEGPKVREGILRGIYLLKAGSKARLRCQILASGPMVLEALKAQDYLLEHYDVGADVYSVTSYQQLYRDGRAAMRKARLAPYNKAPVPYLTQVLEKAKGPSVAVSDFVEELPSMCARFIPHRLVPLGANGFGRSDTRESLRKHFEIDCDHIVLACMSALCQEGAVSTKVFKDAAKKLNIAADKPDPQIE
ncbi:MAG: hypothetical protein EOO38_29150 [Cytophagaceae bacterium]|nr:MAG: hypothetical protein EOO38_29150 [Cytophagaceae bacterium]